MNFPPGYDPSMLNNVNVDQMKMASDMFAGMSDEQIRSYAKMMGMPNMDPNMLRSSASMMKNMDQSQLDNMKNMAKNLPKQGATNAGSNTPTNQNTQSTSSKPKVAESTAPSRYSLIDKLKNKGNDFFKQGSYDEAASSYFEAIIEIEEVRSKNKNLQDEELDTLEVSCRLNYANVKAKLNEYDIVLTQSKAVLNIKENGKAYFRLGQAYFHFKKYEEAVKSLDKAVELIPSDETISELRQKAKQALQEKEGSANENKETKKQPKEEVKKEEEQEAPKEQTQSKPKMKKKNAPDADITIPESQKKQTKVEPDFDYKESQKEEVVIEEEKVPESKPLPRQQEAPKSSSYNAPPDFTSDKIKKGQEELGKMQPEQLKTMTEYFKNMDNATLKSMLKMQSGMDISDEQLENMKKMMTPEMLQSMSKMDMSNMPRNPNQQAWNTTAAPTTTTSGTIPTQQNQAQDPPLMGDQPGFPGSGLDLGSDQVQNMLEMVSSNPEMLKNMVGMLGENHPVAKLVKNRSPEELAKYVGYLKKLLKVYGKMSPLIKFVRSYWQLMAGALLGYIFYRLFSK